MAVNGMNVARLNMSHGTHEWHSSVIERIRKLNKTKGCVLRIFADWRSLVVHHNLLVGPCLLANRFCTSSCRGTSTPYKCRRLVVDTSPDHA